jgi:hypothetical protein
VNSWFFSKIFLDKKSPAEIGRNKSLNNNLRRLPIDLSGIEVAKTISCGNPTSDTVV